MLEWIATLIPPEVALHIGTQTRDTRKVPPEEGHRADVEDGGRLEVYVWGSGTPQAPMILFLRYGRPRPPEGADPGPGRFPTLEEIGEALDMFARQGSIFSISGLCSLGREVERMNPGEWSGVTLLQTGALKHSEATRGSIILAREGASHA